MDTLKFIKSATQRAAKGEAALPTELQSVVDDASALDSAIQEIKDAIDDNFESTLIELAEAITETALKGDATPGQVEALKSDFKAKLDLTNDQVEEFIENLFSAQQELAASLNIAAPIFE